MPTVTDKSIQGIIDVLGTMSSGSGGGSYKGMVSLPYTATEPCTIVTFIWRVGAGNNNYLHVSSNSMSTGQVIRFNGALFIDNTNVSMGPSLLMFGVSEPSRPGSSIAFKFA